MTICTRTRDDSGNEPVHVGEANGLRDTDKAVLVELDGKERWLPKSCIHDDSECHSGTTSGKLVLKRWFAEKEKLA